MSESEDSPMSDEEEEEIEDDEEEEIRTSEDESEDDEIETDSGDDESPSDGPESNPHGSGKSRTPKEDAKKAGMKRKAMEKKKVKDVPIKKRKNVEGKKSIKTAAAVVQKKLENKKGKKIEKKSEKSDDAGEVQAQPIASLEDTPVELTGEKQTKTYPAFEEKNVDYNFEKNSPSNIVQRRCKIASNIIISCKNVEIIQNGQTLDIASLSFSRKTKNGKAFDYNMPLSLAPTVIIAIQAIINDNAKFFANMSKEQK